MTSKRPRLEDNGANGNKTGDNTNDIKKSNEEADVENRRKNVDSSDQPMM